MTRRCRTLDEAQDAIKAQEPFVLRNGSTLRGVAEAPSYLGHLPSGLSEGIENAEYVVISYQTPIAWVIDGEATVPDVGYSPSTGQHQYMAAHALGVPFSPGRGRPLAPPPRMETLSGRPRRLRSGGVDGPGEPWYESDDSMSVRFS